jgi:hypothetical protein
MDLPGTYEGACLREECDGDIRFLNLCPFPCEHIT